MRLRHSVCYIMLIQIMIQSYWNLNCCRFMLNLPWLKNILVLLFPVVQIVILWCAICSHILNSKGPGVFCMLYSDNYFTFFHVSLFMSSEPCRLYWWFCLSAKKGGKHPHCSVRQRHFGSGQEWYRKKWSLPHPHAGEDRPEERSHPGWVIYVLCLMVLIMNQILYDYRH